MSFKRPTDKLEIKAFLNLCFVFVIFSEKFATLNCAIIINIYINKNENKVRPTVGVGDITRLCSNHA